MEKKKLLLVAISVGVFLVITIGAALIIAPKLPGANQPVPVSRIVPGGQTGITVPPSYSAPVTDTPGYTEASRSVDAVDLVRRPGEVPGLQPSPYGRRDTFSDTIISIPRPSSVAVPESAPAGSRAVTVSRPAADSAKPAPEKPAVSTNTVKAPAKSQPAKPQSKAQDDFWVQTGAFSTLAKAEGVKQALATKGINSLIDNRDVNGSTLFRVRVGPYTSQNEANYWLSLIKTINGFEESQVRQTKR